jgi:hypothetical protein
MYAQEIKNLENLKFYIFLQKSECLTLYKLELERIVEIVKNPDTMMRILNFYYLFGKDFEGKDKLPQTKEEFLTKVNEKEFSEFFSRELKNQLFKQFDY